MGISHIGKTLSTSITVLAYHMKPSSIHNNRLFNITDHMQLQIGIDVKQEEFRLAACPKQSDAT